MENPLHIIDFKKTGNVVRLFIGDAEKDYYGDDWDDAPYEHNAGQVYPEFIKKYMDVAFGASHTVMEPQDDWRYDRNSPFSKEDMKKGKCPYIIVIPEAVEHWAGFSNNMGNNNVFKAYLGEDFNSFIMRAQKEFGEDFVCLYVRNYQDN